MIAETDDFCVVCPFASRAAYQIWLLPKNSFHDFASIDRKMRDELGATIVITEQNANFAMTLAERLYVLESGVVKAQGTVDELRNDKRLTEAYFGH